MDDSPRTPLEDALQFIEEQDETYTDEALYDALVDAGYPSDVASEALRQREEVRLHEAADHEPTDPEPADPSGEGDKRGKAALVLIGGAALAWLACVVVLLLLVREGDGFIGAGSIGVAILAVVLGIVLLITLLVATSSRSLKAGAKGAITGFVVIPFVFFFGLAGTCVVITTSLQ